MTSHCMATKAGRGTNHGISHCVARKWHDGSGWRGNESSELLPGRPRHRLEPPAPPHARVGTALVVLDSRQPPELEGVTFRGRGLNPAQRRARRQRPRRRSGTPDLRRRLTQCLNPFSHNAQAAGGRRPATPNGVWHHAPTRIFVSRLNPSTTSVLVEHSQAAEG